MIIKKIDTEQLSFSFWRGYVLLEYYEISDLPEINTISLEEMFIKLKKSGFGKHINIFNDYNVVELDYGIYNLKNIKFDMCKKLNKTNFISSIVKHIKEDFLENTKEEKNSFERIESIIELKLRQVVKEFDIILTNNGLFPPTEIQMRYEFYIPYFLLNKNFTKFLHIEIACD